MSTTVLIVDDHAIMRDGLRRMFEDTDDITVVGEAADGLEAVQKAAQLCPQVVLLDISMPQMSGLEAVRRIKDVVPETAVVFLTMHESEQYFLEALRYRAEGYVPKSAPASEVLEAVRCAGSGQVYLHPSVTRFLLETYFDRPAQEDASDPYHTLTPREREILNLVAVGLTNQDIAQRLVLSPHTVHRHRTNLMQKLGLHDRMHLLRYCIRRGLIDPVTT